MKEKREGEKKVNLLPFEFLKKKKKKKKKKKELVRKGKLREGRAKLKRWFFEFLFFSFPKGKKKVNTLVLFDHNP